MRYGIVPIGVIAATAPEVVAHAERAWGRPIEEFLDRSVPAIRYTLDLLTETSGIAAGL